MKTQVIYNHHERFVRVTSPCGMSTTYAGQISEEKAKEQAASFFEWFKNK